MRELRVLVYAQFLESYKSVRLASMAQAFGVSIDFLDKCVMYTVVIIHTHTHTRNPLP